MGFLDGWKEKRFLDDAESALERGDFRAAIHALTDAIHLKPNCPEAQYQLRLSPTRLSRCPRRTRPQRRRPRHPVLRTGYRGVQSPQTRPTRPPCEAHNDRGRALAKIDRLSEADEAFGDALEQRPDFEAASFNRRWLRGQMSRLEALDIEGVDHQVMREYSLRAS
jgi:tetratricopeptide (TPR) repeat protein